MSSDSRRFPLKGVLITANRLPGSTPRGYLHPHHGSPYRKSLIAAGDIKLTRHLESTDYSTWRGVIGVNSSGRERNTMLGGAFSQSLPLTRDKGFQKYFSSALWITWRHLLLNKPVWRQAVSLLDKRQGKQDSQRMGFVPGWKYVQFQHRTELMKNNRVCNVGRFIKMNWINQTSLGDTKLLDN